MSRESNPKFQASLVKSLQTNGASEALVHNASIFIAEHLDTFSEWLDSFLQYLTLGGKDTTTGEDAELASGVVEQLKEENVDPLEYVETPEVDPVSDVDPVENVPQPAGHVDSQPTSENAEAQEDAAPSSNADAEDEEGEEGEEDNKE